MNRYNTRIQIINTLGIIIALISLVITGYLQFKDPQTGMIFVLGILIFLVLYFIISFPIIKLIERLHQIRKNTSTIEAIQKDLNKIKGTLDIITDTVKLNLRLDSLERKMESKRNKKAQIDPRIIILIIILFLLVLYLRVKGIF